MFPSDWSFMLKLGSPACRCPWVSRLSVGCCDTESLSNTSRFPELCRCDSLRDPHARSSSLRRNNKRKVHPHSYSSQTFTWILQLESEFKTAAFLHQFKRSEVTATCCLTWTYLNTPAAGKSERTVCSPSTPPAPAGFCTLGHADPSPAHMQTFCSSYWKCNMLKVSLNSERRGFFLCEVWKRFSDNKLKFHQRISE